MRAALATALFRDGELSLARVDGFPWLHHLLGTVRIPQEVAGELLAGNFPGDEARIRRAIEAGWIQVVPEVPEGPPLPDLDACLLLIASAREVFARLHAGDFRIAPEVITTVLLAALSAMRR